MYGEPTDPVPFIAAAYGLGFVLLFGYTIWLLREYRKNLAFRAALNGEDQKDGR
jgi:hypothetical protein